MDYIGDTLYNAVLKQLNRLATEAGMTVEKFQDWQVKKLQMLLPRLLRGKTDGDQRIKSICIKYLLDVVITYQILLKF